jgi:hypothetical protein
MKIQLMLISVLSAAALHAGDYIQKNVSVCYETFSLPLSMAAKLHRERLPDQELYERLVAAIAKETVRQETVTVLRCVSDQKSTTDSISEQIYPTEYEPGGKYGPSAVTAPPPVKDGAEAVPSGAKAGGAATTVKSAGITAPATPTSFDTRNTGVTLELEPTLSDDEKLVDLRITPEQVTLVGRSSFGQGISTFEMPVFETQRIATLATIRINRPFLLSTMNRPPVSKVDPDSANRVWFAFVTATLAKP